MGWGDTVSIVELGEFVLKYPKFRLTCLTAVERDFRRSTYYGKDFEQTEIDPSTTKNNNPFIIYVYFDYQSRHYASEKHPARLFDALTGSGVHYRFCHKCPMSFTTSHSCEFIKVPSYVTIKKETCERCLKDFQKGKHFCGKYVCSNCDAKIPKGYDHTCAVMTRETSDKGYWDGTSPYEKGKPGLWVFDIETVFEKVFVPCFTLYDFETDESDQLVPVQNVAFYKTDFKEQDGGFHFKHNVDLVVLKNSKSKERFIFKGYDKQADPFGEMFDMLMNTNNGDHIVLAHNASGYDSVFIYNYMVNHRKEFRVSSINNGSKFLELKISSPKQGNFIKIRDTMKHLPMSLRNLAEAFVDPGMKKEMSKGYFPFLFMDFEVNGEKQPAHMYHGKIPSLDYFDTTFCTSESEYKGLIEHHTEWSNGYDDPETRAKYTWNYKDRKETYCILDVDILDIIVEKVDADTFEKFEICQWKFVTMPACISQAFKIYLTRLYELPDSNDSEYLRLVEEAATKYWSVDKPQEYASTRMALRGGSTDTRRLFYKPKDDEEIVYLDQNSQYPAQQIIPGKKFSRGPPKVHVFDEKWAPCFKHRYSTDMCFTCPRNDRFSPGHGINLIYETKQWSEETIKSIQDCGVIHCRVFVPNMFHPPIMIFKDDRAFSPCGEFDCSVPIFNIQDALYTGVKILEIYRIDLRKSGDSLWRDFMIPLYIDKECASKNMPPKEEWDQMINDWEVRAEMGDDIRKALYENRYKKDSVTKTLAKFRLNNIWGKNAENPVKTSLVTVDTRIQKDKEMWYKMFEDCSDQKLEIQSCVPIADDRHIYRIIKTGEAPNLSKGYLPAAVEVPAYGRRDQWVERMKIGKNLLYNDTDSVCFIHKKGEYLPKIDNLIGGWEFEKDYAAGIAEAVFPAPKNYALLLKDGEEVVKAKGVRIGRNTEKIVNYKSMKQNVMKAFTTKGESTISVPQRNFVHKIGFDTRTILSIKKMTATVTGQKGYVDTNGLIFPFGYTGSDFDPLLK